MILGFGESSVDEVLLVPELPQRSASKVPISSSTMMYGGQVATCMAACAALGLPTAYLGPVGDDDDGRQLLGRLQEKGVDVSRVLVRRAPTRRAVILVEQATGERFVLWERDRALDVAPRELSPALLDGAEVVHVDAVDETASIHLASLARASGARVTCDVDRVTTRTGELLAAITHPILAADVPAALTGVSDLEASLRALRTRHPGVLCVTLGDRGSAALDGDRFLFAPAFQVAVVDSTGAGDVFRAGFVYGLVQGWPTGEVLRFANAAAAVNCTRAGAMAGVPDRHDIIELLNR